MTRLAIKLYANEDGLGPAIGVYYVVQGLVRAFEGLSSGHRYASASLDLLVQSNKVFITQYSFAALLGQEYHPGLREGDEWSFSNGRVNITVARYPNRFELA